MEEKSERERTKLIMLGVEMNRERLKMKMCFCFLIASSFSSAKCTVLGEWASVITLCVSTVCRELTWSFNLGSE